MKPALARRPAVPERRKLARCRPSRPGAWLGLPFGGLALALVLGLWTTPVAAVPFEKIIVSGHSYVRLRDWAQANNLDLAWLKRQEAMQIKSAADRVVVTVDSMEASMNGVQIWLLLPVIQREQRVYVSQLDIQTTLQPLLLPSKVPAGRKLSTICLDPGHGGRDPGNQVGWAKEKSYTLLLAREVRDQLQRAGFAVTFTRTTDAYLDLESRPELANRRKADLFLSLHFNASPSSRGTVHGCEVYSLTPAGAHSTNVRGPAGSQAAVVGNGSNDRNILLAYHLQRALVKSLGVPDRGARRARFAVLRDAAMPAALIEAGFMSHPVEGKKIFSATYRSQIASAIVEGVLAYKKATER